MMTGTTKALIVVAVVLAAVAACEGIFYWQRSVRVSELEGKSKDLATQIAGANDALAGRERLLARHDAVKQSVARIADVLPPPETLDDDAAGELVSGWARAVQLQLRGFEGQPPATDAETGVTRHDFRITLRGTFDQYVRFLNAVETNEKFFQVTAFSLTPSGRDGDESVVLNITATLSTFSLAP